MQCMSITVTLKYHFCHLALQLSKEEIQRSIDYGGAKIFIGLGGKFPSELGHL